MKEVKRIKITEADLKPSVGLSTAGEMMYHYPMKDGAMLECPLYGIVSDGGCLTEAEALENLNKKLSVLFEEMLGDEYYSLDAEIRIWHGRATEEQTVPYFVAYEQVVLPGLEPEEVRAIIKNIKK